MRNNNYIGLLSGTSMDAIDVALCNIDGEQLKLISSHSEPLCNTFKAKCTGIIKTGECKLNDLGKLDIEFARAAAKAILNLLANSGMVAKDIRAIGSHGQNIWHQPEKANPFSWQIGDPNIIATMTKIPVIADFRRADMAAGGQGAPLAPNLHTKLFRSSLQDRVIVNLGGIANITVLPKNLELPVLGYDSGPANCLLDAWAKKNLNQEYDINGEFAASGNICYELLDKMLEDKYFALAAPKSTGVEYFNLNWVMGIIKGLAVECAPADIQATLLELTCKTVAAAIKTSAPKSSLGIYLCGGGTKNPQLIQQLQQNLPEHQVTTTADLGVPPDWIEAALFAFLAKLRLDKAPGNVPSVTGARKSVCLGAVYDPVV